MARDHYEVLGVARGASADEIKRVYRRLARQYHPDANSGDAASEERFKEITRAYEVLSDPEKRQRYDMFGDERVAGFGDGDFGGISDLFAEFFGGVSGRSRRGPARGADVVAEIELTLEEAAAGVEREIEVETQATCSECSGSGAAPGTAPARCVGCGGTGELRSVRRTILGNVVTASTCRRCNGSGHVIESPCARCNGRGRMRVTDALTVQIPAGVDDGAQLRVSGRGEAGPRGSRAGDLYVVLHVAPHPVFRRAGDDLGCEVVVPMTVAALGGTIDVPTLDGPEEVEVAAGTQSGEVVRLRGRGMPRVDGGRRGELVALLKVETPGDLDERQEDLLRELAELRGERVGPRGLLDRIKEAFK